MSDTTPNGTGHESEGQESVALFAPPQSPKEGTMRASLFISLRWKITALVGFVVLLIAAGDAYYVPARAAEAQREALRDRALAHAAMIAMTSANELGVGVSASDALRPALVDPLVLWIAAFDAEGALIGRAERHGSAGKPPGRLDEQTNDARVLSMTETQLVVASPIHPRQGDGRTTGSVVLAMDSSRIAVHRNEARAAILTQAAIVGLFGLGLALFVASRMTLAIGRMRDALAQIARGDVSSELRLITTRDELGTMAHSLRAMTERLRDLQDAVTKVAEGNLNAEVNGEGELFQSFGRMVVSLREMATRISRGSSRLASAAAGMFSAVREQETIATQQTSSLEEIRRTLEALSRAAEGVASDADAVRDMAERSLASSQRMAEQTRMVSTLDRLRAAHPGGTIVCVSHADTIKAAVAHAMGTHIDLFQRIVISPASVTAIGWGPGGPVVLAVNSTGRPLTDLQPS